MKDERMSEYIHKAHNVVVLIHHIVCPAKYIWREGHFVRTKGKQGNEGTITNYVKTQETEKEYKQLHKI
jgi:hypothetical protein